MLVNINLRSGKYSINLGLCKEKNAKNAGIPAEFRHFFVSIQDFRHNSDVS